jgi:hypothetical protein
VLEEAEPAWVCMWEWYIVAVTVVGATGGRSYDVRKCARCCEDESAADVVRRFVEVAPRIQGMSPAAKDWVVRRAISRSSCCVQEAEVLIHTEIDV